MITEKKQKYIELAEKHNEQELAEILQVNARTIRRYAKELNVRPKPTKYTNISLSVWKQKFNELYNGRLELKDPIYRDKRGHVRATCKCLQCQTEWVANINEKIRIKTGCILCDKGNHGNKYDEDTVRTMLNKQYDEQWELVSYGHYSEKDSIIRCTLCNHEQLVKLSDFINSTTMRCIQCQTGSFGEYIIANTLLYNKISFSREKTIRINNHRYRLDFLINDEIALEYSGLQHFNKGLYYNEKINTGVLLKQTWCEKQGYKFIEIIASYDIKQIVKDLSKILQINLQTPTPEFFRHNNPDIQTVLTYMKTHSSRKTAKDLNIPITKLRKYIFLNGYQSISAWQADNKIDI